MCNIASKIYKELSNMWPISKDNSPILLLFCTLDCRCFHISLPSNFFKNFPKNIALKYPKNENPTITINTLTGANKYTKLISNKCNTTIQNVNFPLESPIKNPFFIVCQIPFENLAINGNT